MCILQTLPSPIATIAAGRRPPEEAPLRAVVSPEARTPPPRVAERARVRVARVPAVRTVDVIKDRIVTLVERRSHCVYFLLEITTASRVASRQSRADGDDQAPHDHVTSLD